MTRETTFLAILSRFLNFSVRQRLLSFHCRHYFEFVCEYGWLAGDGDRKHKKRIKFLRKTPKKKVLRVSFPLKMFCYATSFGVVTLRFSEFVEESAVNHRVTSRKSCGKSNLILNIEKSNGLVY